MVPARADVDLDVAVDRLRFTADVLVPLEVRVTVDQPLTLVWTVTPPAPGEVSLTVNTDTRRATRIDLGEVIEGVWPVVAEQVLPDGPDPVADAAIA